MESRTVQLIESKGINVPKGDYEILTKRWTELQEIKPNLNQMVSINKEIDYKYVPGGWPF